jgi:hypothetical protein
MTWTETHCYTFFFGFVEKCRCCTTVNKQLNFRLHFFFNVHVNGDWIARSPIILVG